MKNFKEHLTDIKIEPDQEVVVLVSGVTEHVLGVIRQNDIYQVGNLLPIARVLTSVDVKVPMDIIQLGRVVSMSLDYLPVRSKVTGVDVEEVVI